MFHLPEAKRVRREELVDEADVVSEGSSGEDEMIRARLEAQMALSLGLADMDVDKAPTTTAAATSVPAASSRQKSDGGQATVARARASREPSSSDDEDEGEHGLNVVAGADADSADGREEYDFCLFGGVGVVPTKVVLEDDSRPRGEGGLDAQRPRTFYLAGQPSDEERRRYAYAAVTGDQILERSRQRWWGMEYPWRVTHITTAGKEGADGHVRATNVAAGDGHTEEREEKINNEKKNKKRRPGKKTRLARRIKERTITQKKEEAEKKAEEKEEHIKEKKKRMNRLKKLRKRAKNREQKVTSQGDGGGDEGEGDSSD